MVHYDSQLVGITDTLNYLEMDCILSPSMSSSTLIFMWHNVCMNLIKLKISTYQRLIIIHFIKITHQPKNQHIRCRLITTHVIIYITVGLHISIFLYVASTNIKPPSITSRHQSTTQKLYCEKIKPLQNIMTYYSCTNSTRELLSRVFEIFWYPAEVKGMHHCGIKPWFKSYYTSGCISNSAFTLQFSIHPRKVLLC